MDRKQLVESLVGDFKSSLEQFLAQAEGLSFEEASSQMSEMMREHVLRVDQARIALTASRLAEGGSVPGAEGAPAPDSDLRPPE